MAPLGKGTQPLKHQNAHSHWRGLGFILGALLRCFFSRGSGSTPGSPSPMLWSGLGSGRVAQPLPERAVWGAPAALVGKAGQGRLRKRPGLG